MRTVSHFPVTAESLRHAFGLALPVQMISTPIEGFSFLGTGGKAICFGMAGTSYFNNNSFRVFLPQQRSQLPYCDIEVLLQHAINIAKQWGGRNLLLVSDTLPDRNSFFHNWEVSTQHHYFVAPQAPQTKIFENKFSERKRYRITAIDNNTSKAAHEFVVRHLGQSAFASASVNRAFSFLVTDSKSGKYIACLLASGRKTMHIHALAIHPEYRRSLLFLTMLYQLSLVVREHNIQKLSFSFFDQNADMKKLATRWQIVEKKVEHYASTTI